MNTNRLSILLALLLGACAPDSSGDARPPSITDGETQLTSISWDRYAIVYRDQGTPSTSFEVPVRSALANPTYTDTAVGTLVGSDLQDLIDDYVLNGTDPAVTAIVWPRDPDGLLRDGNPIAAVWEGWVSGTLTSQAAWDSERSAALTQRRADIDTVQASVLPQLSGSWVEVSRGDQLPFFIVDANVSVLSSWVGQSRVGSIGLNGQYQDEADGADIEGAVGLSFYGPTYTATTPGARDYDGELPSTFQTVIIEGFQPAPFHPLYFDGVGSSRLHPTREEGTLVGVTTTTGWGSVNCSSATGFDCGPHGVQIIQLHAGDITLGQDPLVPTFNEQVVRSGVARGANGIRYAWHNGQEAAALHLFDRYIGDPNVKLTSNSYGLLPGGADCDATGADERAVNEAFCNGIAVIKSSGNEGSEPFNRCEVTAPGAAAGAFVVGSVWDDEVTWTAQSSRGHKSNRSIVDVASFDKFAPFGTIDNAYNGPTITPTVSQVQGTSYATAIVSGGAALALDHVLDRAGGTNPHLENPGALYAHLLLMGDGQDGDGNSMSLGTSRMTGTGFFRPRPIEGSDLGPIYLNGSVCVDQNEEVSFSLDGSGNALPSGINEITAVAYWMDPRTMEGRDPNKIDLEIEDVTASVTWVDDANRKEDKRRVHATGAFGGHTVWLTLRGTDVRGDADPWCPPERSQRVFFAVEAQ